MCDKPKDRLHRRLVSVKITKEFLACEQVHLFGVSVRVSWQPSHDLRAGKMWPRKSRLRHRDTPTKLQTSEPACKVKNFMMQ